MTGAEKQSEIAQRITRLSEIRSELAIAKSKWDNACKEMAEAGRYYGKIVAHRQIDPRTDKEPEAWPDPNELKAHSELISSLKADANSIIKELKDIDGIDADLFKINGD